MWSDGTFAVPRGAIVIVIGPNGSGKTTLLHLLLGVLAPTTGELSVLGATPARGDARIGYVPQNYAANVGDAVRCRDLVTLGVTGRRWGLRGASADERRRVDEALAAVGATEYAHRRLSELSGGQQQRVAIAQALVDRPDLLLLDEPLANLDVRNQQDIVGVLAHLRDTTDVTILVVAHDMNPLLSVLTGAVYLLDGHPHYGADRRRRRRRAAHPPLRHARARRAHRAGRLLHEERLSCPVRVRSGRLAIGLARHPRRRLHAARVHRRQLVAVAAGMLGYFVVVRRTAFAAHALAHIGFPGATLAALIGAPITLGLAVFCVAGGLSIGVLGREVEEREIATGTILAFATGLGPALQLTRDP